MCDRRKTLTDPTADFVLSDLLSATEDLIDFSINVFDSIRLQSHFNDRNRRVNLAMQLKEASDAQQTEFSTLTTSTKPCMVTTTLKYDLNLYLDRILQSCKRTKANLMLLRISRSRGTNTTLLLVASTSVRVDQLEKKVQLLMRLVKENGGDFQMKKKKKKKESSKTKIEDDTKPPAKLNKKPPISSISKDDLGDYVEIALSFRMIITKYREFIQNMRDATKSILSSNGQASIANSIILIPIAANAISELNNILNRLIRIAFTIEAESNHLRQLPHLSTENDSHELYRQGTKEENEPVRVASSKLLERAPSKKEDLSRSSGTNLKRNTYSLLKQNENRTNFRNQSALASMLTTDSLKLTPNMISNIFEDFFMSIKNYYRGIIVALSFTIGAIIKLSLLPCYHSTDFEVHRNWLALTHSLPLQQWYYENRSEWTLDYPPFFAHFEYGLSKFASYFDPAMLDVNNLNYASEKTKLFQRLTVIGSEIVLALAIYSLMKTMQIGRKNHDIPMPIIQLLFALSLLVNFGLLIVDHMHFQYNGFLLGILLTSISCMYRNEYLMSAIWFSTLLNFKHIFLYIAPAYVVYLFYGFCVKQSSNPVRFLVNLIALSIATLLPFVLSFGPFILMNQLPQVLTRLFPFKRGLCHAYWAPNIWALYNVFDKVLAIVGRYTHIFRVRSVSVSMTSGLVQDIEHQVLPSITPGMTFILTFIFMIPSLIRLFFRCSKRTFLETIILCALTSFLFGWHVHEKAILISIIPLSLLAFDSREHARYFLLLSTFGGFSLFPLIFTGPEIPIKIGLFVAYTAFLFYTLGEIHGDRGATFCLPLLNRLETFSVVLLIPLCLYCECLHTVLHIDRLLPFLPLLLISIYCSIFIVYCWIRLHTIEAHSEDELTAVESTVQFSGRWNKKQRQKQE
ncbi:unnamed protein product [Adineta ricciae]|uniref:dolichyl-P-Glc:Glc1Man9GlcNAc2-PP-dolichol alpha-1,3-glucosyltransferase n=1 Tax=Adineta ricciae TaxID=249248 RepID=A0A813QQK8_ADIRI|nr:unnamed protein product [Adineta ricciae]